LERKNFFFCIEFKSVGFCRVQPAQLWLAVAEAAAAVRTTRIGRSPAVDGEPPREQLRRRRSTGMASTSPSLLTGTSPRDGCTAPRRLGCRRVSMGGFWPANLSIHIVLVIYLVLIKWSNNKQRISICIYLRKKKCFCLSQSQRTYIPFLWNNGRKLFPCGGKEFEIVDTPSIQVNVLASFFFMEYVRGLCIYLFIKIKRSLIQRS